MAQAAKIASHGVTCGLMSVLQKDKFGHGFAAASFTQAFAPSIDGIKGDQYSALRVAVAATIGGTASVLSGGKFANGAVTSAFSRLFNDELHEQKSLKDRWDEASSELSGFVRFQSQLVQSGGISSLEAMARIYEYASGMKFYQVNTGAMVGDLAAILSGVPRGHLTISDGTSPLYVGFDAFGGDGFGALSDQSNQVRHFTAGFNFGFKMPTVSNAINILRPDDVVDEALNIQSTRIGRGLRRGDISLQNLGAEIRALGQ